MTRLPLSGWNEKQIFECPYCGACTSDRESLIEHEEGCPEVLEKGGE